MHRKLMCLVLLLFTSSVPAAAQNCTALPYSFTNGYVASASQVNLNFGYLQACAASTANPLFTGNVAIGTTTPLAALHVVGQGLNGAIYATNTYSGYNTAYGVLPWNGMVDISAGLSYQSGSWIAQNNATTASDLMVMHPGTGVQWYAETGTANGSAITSWNVANDVTLWTDSGYWSNLVQSTTSGTSYFTGGNVGIGTTTPAYALDVAGTINTNQASGFSQAGNTVLYSNPANYTLAVGASAAASWMSSSTSTNWFDVAVGNGALGTSPATYTSAINNTAVGYYALHADGPATSNGNNNSALGSKALQLDTTGYGNTAAGYVSLQSETTGYENSAFGEEALSNATTGDYNVAIGAFAGFRNTTPTESVFIGVDAGIGPASYTNTGSTFVGYKAGYSVAQNGSTTPDYNVLIGFEAGFDVTNGAHNIILAEEDSTKDGISTGNNNILIGSNITVPSVTGSASNNQLDIGNIIFGTGVTGTGTTIAGNIGIGTATPSYLLQVGSSSASGVVFELQNSSGACTHTPGSSSETVACSSDARLKKNIADSGPALPALADIRVRDFTVRATGERKTGVIAQELLKAHPDIVHKGPDGFYKVDEPNPWKLVKAIQELKASNDNQAIQIGAQAAQISQLGIQMATLQNELRGLEQKLAQRTIGNEHRRQHDRLAESRVSGPSAQATAASFTSGSVK